MRMLVRKVRQMDCFKGFSIKTLKDIDSLNDDQNLRMARLSMCGIETEQDFRSWISESIAGALMKIKFQVCFLASHLTSIVINFTNL